SVTYGSGARIARGVVEDIIGGRAMVRVTEAVGGSVSVTAASAVTLSRPASKRGLRFGRKGRMR
ncbi:MAG: hypothetical protein ACPGVJ_03855, partial [Mangrovicoccus sp.]